MDKSKALVSCKAAFLLRNSLSTPRRLLRAGFFALAHPKKRSGFKTTRAIRAKIGNGINPIPEKILAAPARFGAVRPKSVRGAYGGVAKKAAARLSAFREHQGQAIEVARERSLKREYAKFFATTAGKQFVKQFGRSIDIPNRNGRKSGSGSDVGDGDGIDFHDPADLPEASFLDHPVDKLEPADTHVEFAIPRSEIEMICATFRMAFQWALDGKDLVHNGLRCNILISRMRVDLGHGLAIDKAIAKKFDARFPHTEFLQRTGRRFALVLEWLRRAESVSTRGERVYLLAYTLCPSAIDARTLASLGEMSGKTRQAKDKLANCLRDTMSGIKALAMRGDITRVRCQRAQLIR